MLIAQLLAEEQVQNNNPSLDTKAVLTNVLSTVTDAELLFAFQRVLRTWTIQTNQADPSLLPDGGLLTCGPGSPLLTSSGGLPAGLKQPTYPSTWPKTPNQPINLTPNQIGVVVQGGMSRSRIATDPTARAGGMTEASQAPYAANTGSDYWDSFGNPTAALTSLMTQQPPFAEYAHLPPVVFQDAFHIGQAFERRLSILGAAAGNLPYTDPANVAKGGITELRNWAGATLVQAHPQYAGSGPGDPSASASIIVSVTGLSYVNDLGIPYTGSKLTGDPLTALGAAFGFVYGPPWVAECAAGTRADCPPNFKTDYVQTGAATDVTGLDAPVGALDNEFSLRVPIPSGTNAPSQFRPPIVDSSTVVQPGESHLYMVRMRDPASTLGHGRVLGTLPLSGSWQLITDGTLPRNIYTGSIVGFVDAPMQRELVHNSLDLGHWLGARPPAIGDPSAGDVSGSCVDGVPMDIFVPLDNELASGTQPYEDSWQAYLAQAKSAAQAADQLGQQLIANDLQISENEQAALTQLSSICGDVGALASVKVGTDGTVTSDPADKTMQACLGESPDGGSALVDIVFLGKMPG
jgi:hypothetical protein